MAYSLKATLEENACSKDGFRKIQQWVRQHLPHVMFCQEFSTYQIHIKDVQSFTWFDLSNGHKRAATFPLWLCVELVFSKVTM